ncbi:ISAon1 family transposase N-terminal region protein, partial [Phocaeicola vulgatus]
RGKKVFLNIRRRRWLLKKHNEYISRNWRMVAEGTRMTQDFASFLKELY